MPGILEGGGTKGFGILGKKFMAKGRPGLGKDWSHWLVSNQKRIRDN